VQFNVHLTPKMAICLDETTCVNQSISGKKVLHLVESWICYALWKSCLNCYMTVCRESGVGDANDLYPENKHNSTSVNPLTICLGQWKTT